MPLVPGGSCAAYEALPRALDLHRPEYTAVYLRVRLVVTGCGRIGEAYAIGGVRNLSFQAVAEVFWCVFPFRGRTQKGGHFRPPAGPVLNFFLWGRLRVQATAWACSLRNRAKVG